jgi:hypothetical protein
MIVASILELNAIKLTPAAAYITPHSVVTCNQAINIYDQWERRKLIRILQRLC